jgi:AraC family transcriptional regulator of adaptative response/methylated-DNA-[protein]-cysteine methyltransferase
MLADADVLYESLAARDGQFAGQALVCVKTTGIFCRMTCSARTPLRRNVSFRATAEECLAAGLSGLQAVQALSSGAALRSLRALIA